MLGVTGIGIHVVELFFRPLIQFCFAILIFDHKSLSIDGRGFCNPLPNSENCEVLYLVMDSRIVNNRKLKNCGTDFELFQLF